jgi:hypothetical protein
LLDANVRIGPAESCDLTYVISGGPPREKAR